ncbi:F-box-like/WD repeat-containing protein ebi, partial [Blattella germanica]
FFILYVQTTSVWEAETGHCIQEFSFHSASVSCVEWMDNITFASGSADKCIYVCKLGMKYNTPFKQFYGHTGEVNSIKWDPEGKLLASCSEDTTLKIWSMTEDVVLNLYGHDKGVCRLAWSPTGPGSPNPNKNRMLASISNDSRIRLWDIHQNTCFHILFVQTDEISSMEFSPDGKLLAAASSKTLQIWSTQDWQIVFNFEADSNFCFISWNLRGYLLAATSLNGNVFVLDTRTLSLVKDSTLSTN